LKSNYWIGKAKENDKLKELDNYFMEAWSNESNFEQILDSMPQDLKEFLFKLKITCPDPIRDGIRVGFTTEEE
jgi:hypothetical protein